MVSKIEAYQQAFAEFKKRRDDVVATSGRITIVPDGEGVRISATADPKGSGASDMTSITLTKTEADFVVRTLKDIFTPA